MKTFKLIALIFMSVLLSLATGNLMAQDQETMTGSVRVIEWDDDGKATAAVLEVESEDTNDEGKVVTYTEEFVIDNDFNGKQLFDLDGEAVEVTCNLLENEEGLVYLKVLSYSVIESDEEDFEEGEPDEPEDPLI